MEEIQTVTLGQHISEFQLDAYLPDKKDFGKVDLKKICASGKWLLLFFYPADYTFVCPTELADMAQAYGAFQKESAEVVAVSTDTHYVHYAWLSSEKLLQNIAFPMAADPTHNLSRAFGVYDGLTGLAFRGTFIIDPDAKLVAAEVNYFPVGRNSDELLRKLRAFKHVRENPSNVCPAKWQPGTKILTPGKDLVGNVAQKLG